MTLYGYARVSVREPEDKNLDLQVERLVRAGCSLGNIRAEEASGAKNDRGGLLELLDLVVEGDTLTVTHIDRLARGLTYGLQVIEGLHRAGVEFRSLSEDFNTATATGKLQLTMVLAFSEWWRNSIRERSVAGQAKARTFMLANSPWWYTFALPQWPNFSVPLALGPGLGPLREFQGMDGTPQTFRIVFTRAFSSGH